MDLTSWKAGREANSAWRALARFGSAVPACTSSRYRSVSGASLVVICGAFMQGEVHLAVIADVPAGGLAWVGGVIDESETFELVAGG